ncbi:MAG: gamma-glutamyltransferase [Gammaproteobacteria bacterium]|nr:MAG: gamma-glutamyltransferase [Gammaproteobacteria bacterium]
MTAKGAIAAGHKLTADTAELILHEGGNAFDAAVAAHFTACVAEPVLCSLGGGGFLLAYGPLQDPVMYDFFTQTPHYKQPSDALEFYPVQADFGTAIQEFHIGQGSVATPGCIKGLFEIHHDLCTIPMRELVTPAVTYARGGVCLNELQAYIFSIVSPIYLASDDTRALFESSRESGRVIQKGETLYQRQLADTMEALAYEGDDLFYRGEIAALITRQCTELGGHLTRDDLNHYQVIRRKPLAFSFLGTGIQTNPPPASGGILIAFAMKLLEHCLSDAHTFGTVAYLNTLIDCMVVTQRARIDAYNTHGTDSLVTDHLLDPELLKRYHRQVKAYPPVSRGTTHLGIMDKIGNVASLSLSNGEGCGRHVPGTGVMLNNMLGEEDLNATGFHGWSENVRMCSMMAPCLIMHANERLITTGSGGSNRIRSALMQVMTNLIAFDMPVEQAVASPRVHYEHDLLSIEGEFDPGVIKALTTHYAKHHVWDSLNLFFGGTHTLALANGEFSGAGDPRRGGVFKIAY